MVLHALEKKSKRPKKGNCGDQKEGPQVCTYLFYENFLIGSCAQNRKFSIKYKKGVLVYWFSLKMHPYGNSLCLRYVRISLRIAVKFEKESVKP